MFFFCVSLVLFVCREHGRFRENPGKTGNTGCPPDSGNISSLPRACNRQACWLMQVVVCRYEILNTPMFVDMFFWGGGVLWSKCICCTHCLLESKDFMFF